jgi:serine/threonine protein kinase
VSRESTVPQGVGAEVIIDSLAQERGRSKSNIVNPRLHFQGITDTEWSAAEEELAGKPTGTKLNRKDSGYTNSFILIDDVVYALAAKVDGSSHFISQPGSFYFPKYAMTRDGKFYIYRTPKKIQIVINDICCEYKEKGWALSDEALVSELAYRLGSLASGYQVSADEDGLESNEALRPDEAQIEVDEIELAGAHKLVSIEGFGGCELTNFNYHSLLYWGQILDICIHMVDYLEDAHQQDILHCDVKIDNILILNLWGRRFASLIDWDLSEDLEENESTVYAKWKGTERYLAPEIKKPDEDRKVVYSRKTDVFALGFVFGEMAEDLGKQDLFPKVKAVLEAVSTKMKAHNADSRPELSKIKDDLQAAKSRISNDELRVVPKSSGVRGRSYSFSTKTSSDLTTTDVAPEGRVRSLSLDSAKAKIAKKNESSRASPDSAGTTAMASMIVSQGFFSYLSAVLFGIWCYLIASAERNDDFFQGDGCMSALVSPFCVEPYDIDNDQRGSTSDIANSDTPEGEGVNASSEDEDADDLEAICMGVLSRSRSSSFSGSEIGAGVDKADESQNNEPKNKVLSKGGGQMLWAIPPVRAEALQSNFPIPVC